MFKFPVEDKLVTLTQIVWNIFPRRKNIPYQDVSLVKYRYEQNSETLVSSVRSRDARQRMSILLALFNWATVEEIMQAAH